MGVELGLVHMKDGGMRLGAESDKNANDVLMRLNDVIEAKGSATSSLKSFAVRNAKLTLFDEVTGLHFVAPKASLVMSARNDAIGLQFNSDVVVSGDTAHVKADMTLPPDKGPIEGNVLITGLDLRALAANAEMFKPLSKLALSVNLAARYSVAPGAHLIGIFRSHGGGGPAVCRAQEQRTACPPAAPFGKLRRGEKSPGAQSSRSGRDRRSGPAQRRGRFSLRPGRACQH